MNHRQQQTDVVDRMRQRMAAILAAPKPAAYDWRERPDDDGDRIVAAERRERDLERGDSPLTHWWV